MSAGVCILWAATLSGTAHPDPLVARCLLAYKLTAAAYSRVSVSARSISYRPDGSEKHRQDWHELSDGARYLRHTPEPDPRAGLQTARWEAVEVQGCLYSFHVSRRDGGKWELSFGVGGLRAVPRSWASGLWPFDLLHDLARSETPLTARRVVWRGEPVVELRYRTPTWLLPVEEDYVLPDGSVFLGLGRPGLVRGRRCYSPDGSGRWLQEEKFEYRPDDGPWPGLVRTDTWNNSPQPPDQPYLWHRTEFTQYKRLDQPPDPARFTLSAFGLPEPAVLPFYPSTPEPVGVIPPAPSPSPPAPDDSWQWWAIGGILVVGAVAFVRAGRTREG